MSLEDSTTKLAAGFGLEIPRIPEYEILRCIGAGGYGKVFLARNSLGGYCAIKIVWHASAPDDKAYERELKGLRLFADFSRLDPGFVDVLHIGRNDAEGYFYYVMELGDPVAGETAFDPNTYFPRTLQSELDRRGALPPAECVRLGISLSSALGFLHQQGLVHRDVKPANIIYVHGIPRLADPGLVSQIASEMSAVGTLAFMDATTHGQRLGDIYSLGRVLYVAATGMTASQFPSLPTAVAEANREFLELNEVLLRAGASDATSRYQTMEDLLAHLALIQAGESIRTGLRLARWWRQLRKHAAWVGALLVLGVFSLWQILQLLRQSGELRERRVGSYLAYGTAAVDAHNYLEALPWFAGALEIEQGNAERARKHRLRLGSTLAASPHLIQFWNNFKHASGAQFSLDGDHVLVPGSNSTILTLDIATGRCVSQVPLGVNSDDHVVLGPGGRLAFTAGADTGACVWNATNGQRLLTLLPAPVSGVDMAAAFTLKEEILALASRTGGVVWAVECASGKKIWSEIHTGGYIEHLAWNHSGNLLAVSTRTNGVQVVDSGRVVSVFTNHTSWIYSAAFSPRDLIVASADYDRFVRLWLYQSRQELMQLPHDGAISEVVFSPDGERLATGASDNLARIFDARSYRMAGPPLPHENKVIHLAFSPTGRRLLTASYEGTIRVWDLEVADKQWSARCLTASGTGRRLAWCESSNVVVCLDSAADQSPGRWTNSEGSVATLLLDSNGRYLLSCTQPLDPAGESISRASLWDIADRRLVGPGFSIPGSSQKLLSPDGTKLAIVSDGLLVVWDTFSGELLRRVALPSATRICLAWHPFADRLAIGMGLQARVYDVTAGRFAWPAAIKHSMAIVSICFSPDGRLVATACADSSADPGEARIWNAETGASQSPPLQHKDGVKEVAFSPDGRWVATACEDFTATVWEIATGRIIGRPLRSPDVVTSVCFGLTRTWLVTACRNGTVRVWDLETSEPLTPPMAPLLARGARITRVQFVEGDKSLLIETLDGRPWLWRLSFDDHKVEELRQWARILSAERSGPLSRTQGADQPTLAESFAKLNTANHAGARGNRTRQAE